MLNTIADFFVWLYKMNRKTLQLRGGYRLLKLAGRVCPKLRYYPVSFGASGIHYADVRDPDTFWLLNAFVGDVHPSLRHLARLLASRSKRGAIVWDIGGSMGLFTIEMLNAAPHVGAIHVFEPNPVPMRVAQDLLSPINNVTMHSVALGDQAGTATLFDGDEGSGTGGSSLSPAKARNRGIEVRVETGDALVKNTDLPAPDIVKIDVEGFEPNVLLGMREIISQKMPVIALEILFLTKEQILEIIPQGYRIRYIRESDGQLCEDYEVARLGGCMDALLEPA
ncbi:MAG: FkbM family methyltransferase [Verrucomicrobia bacterium]|nr:MAG: FkbM family methyltransferase [Verrucomicrobiota bacterium]